jgi:hypothetical protein
MHMPTNESFGKRKGLAEIGAIGTLLAVLAWALIGAPAVYGAEQEDTVVIVGVKARTELCNTETPDEVFTAFLGYVPTTPEKLDKESALQEHQRLHELAVGRGYSQTVAKG